MSGSRACLLLPAHVSLLFYDSQGSPMATIRSSATTCPFWARIKCCRYNYGNLKTVGHVQTVPLHLHNRVENAMRPVRILPALASLFGHLIRMSPQEGTQPWVWTRSGGRTILQKLLPTTCEWLPGVLGTPRQQVSIPGIPFILEQLSRLFQFGH